MEKARAERLTEAYEILYNECKLQAYLHRYPSASPASEKIIEEVDSTADHASDSATDSESSSLGSVGDDFGPPTDDNDDDTESSEPDHCLASWTEAELALLFPSLSRRSRWFPDLIAQDLGFTKSPSQVGHLLTLLKRQSERHEKMSLALPQQNGKSNVPSRAQRKARRIAAMPRAYEISDEWLRMEETMAAQLQKWQDIEDCEEEDERMNRRSEQQAEGEDEQEDESGAMFDSSIVSWDTQVINALLYLRHSPECSPDSNPANFTYNVPLAAWSGESELELHCFSASLAVDLFANKGLTKGRARPLTAYKSFSRCHPTPNTHFRLQSKSKTLAWRMLLRGVELGILAWVLLGAAKTDTLPEGTLPDSINRKIKSTQANKAVFDRAQKHHLVWLDTVSGDSRSAIAKQLLQSARGSATMRLIQTLQWDEALAINESLTCMTLSKANAEEAPVGSQRTTSHQTGSVQAKGAPATDFSFDNVDLSSYSYAERNKIRARFRARVARYGREAALAMPIEAQKVGRKRKGEDYEQNGTNARKRARSEQISQQANGGDDEGDADDEAGAEEEEDEEVAESEVSSHMHLSTKPLPRFEQIGVSLETVMSLLSQAIKDSLELFNVKSLKQTNLINEKYSDERDDLRIGGISPDTLTRLSRLLHEYLTRMMSSVIEVVASGLNSKGELRKLISAEDIRAALLLHQSDHTVLKQDETGIGSSAAALSHFRSDPPRLYHYDANQRQELQAQLYGLKSLRSMSQQHRQHSGSILSDVVISTSDAFSTPILSAYAPQDTMTTIIEPVIDIPSSSDESSLYNDSEEERAITAQRDQSRGVPKEATWVDGRAREYNEKRELEEDRRWDLLNQRDEVQSARHERRLWASLGLQPKEPRDQNEEASSAGTESSEEEDSNNGADYGEEAE